MLWLTVASLALGGTTRTLVEVGPDGRVPLRSWVVPGPAKSGIAVDPRQRTLLLPDGRGVGGLRDRAVGLEEQAGGILRASPLPDLAVPIQHTGPSGARLDLVFLGDGYTADEMGRFAADVERVVDHLLTIAPYGAYTSAFNIWRVDTPSAESGATHLDPPVVARDTALGCYYGCLDIPQLVCCDDVAVLDTAAGAVPGYDGVLVLINDPLYGGSGGFAYATAYTGDFDGHQVAAHELGHTLVGLWDEYGYTFEVPGYEGGPNCAIEPDGAWDEWIGSQGVGAFPDCSYSYLHRPTEHDCLMHTLSEDYCAVCRQEAIYAIYFHMDGMVERTDPPAGAEVDARRDDVVIEVVANGADSGLEFEWAVDGEVVSREQAFNLRCSGVDGDLWLRVYDDTPWVRTDPYGLLEEIVGPWKVRSTRCRAVACGCDAAPRSGPALVLLALVLAVRRRGGRP